MKLLKILSAGIVAAAVAATMVFSASAATTEDVLQAAKDAGLPETHEYYTLLENHLKTANYTAEQNDILVAAAKDAGTKYVAPIAEKLGYDVANLTNDQLKEVLAQMPAADKQAIKDALVKAGNDVGTKVTVEGNKPVIGDTPVDKPVAGTGVAETTNTAAVAFTGFAALALASAGVVAISKKTK